MRHRQSKVELSTWRIAGPILIGINLCILTMFTVDLIDRYVSDQRQAMLLADCHSVISDQSEVLKAGSAMLNSASNAIESSAKLNYFLDQGIRMQQTLDTIGKSVSELHLETVECEGM